MTTPPAPDFSGITEILKRQYETGEFGSAHFRVPTIVVDAMRSAFLPRGTTSWPPLGAPSRETFMGIPVVVDETIPEGTWRLVDTHTGEILHEGTT